MGEIKASRKTSIVVDTPLPRSETPRTNRQPPSSKDTLEEPQSKTSSTEKSSCWLVSCFNCIKDGIVSFFHWVCSGFSSPATKEEIDEVEKLLRDKTGDVMSEIGTRYEYNYKKAIAPSLLADFLKIMPLFHKTTTLCMALFDKRVKDTENPIRVSELQSKKNEILSLFKNLTDLIDPKKHPIFRYEGIPIEVENFSLEKIQFFDGDGSSERTIRATFSLLHQTTPDILNDIATLVNGIRVGKGMTLLKP